jgi:thiol:disulfide interchange protein DsbC
MFPAPAAEGVQERFRESDVMKRQTTLRILLSLVVCLVVLSGCKSSAPAKELTKAEAQEALKGMAPDLKVLSLERTPVEGLWEVVVQTGDSKGLVYVDSTGKYVFLGSLVEIATKENITKNRFEELQHVDVSSIPLGDALVMGNPEAAHKVIVFDDPD